MITIPAAKRAIARMSDIRYFPADPDLRAVIMEELAELCADDSQVDWLARRMVDVCREWPRIQGLRQVYFSKYAPRNERQRQLDRESAITEAFPDGVPSETGRLELSAGTGRLELSAGSHSRKIAGPVDSAASEALALVMGGVKGLELPPVPTLEEIEHEIKSA